MPGWQGLRFPSPALFGGESKGSLGRISGRVSRKRLSFVQTHTHTAIRTHARTRHTDAHTERRTHTDIRTHTQTHTDAHARTHTDRPSVYLLLCNTRVLCARFTLCGRNHLTFNTLDLLENRTGSTMGCVCPKFQA